MKKTVAIIAIATLIIVAPYTILPIHTIEQTSYPGVLIKYNRYTCSVQMIRLELIEQAQ